MGQFPTRSVQLPLPTSKFVGSLTAMDTNLYFLHDTFQPGHKIFLVWAKQMDAVSLNFQISFVFSFVLDPYLYSPQPCLLYTVFCLKNSYPILVCYYSGIKGNEFFSSLLFSLRSLDL